MSISRVIQKRIDERLAEYFVEAYSSHYVLHFKSGNRCVQETYRARKDIIEDVARNLSFYTVFHPDYWKELKPMFRQSTRNKFRKKTEAVRKEVEKELNATLEW